MKPLAFIDVETSGLHPEMGHEIIEICIIKKNDVLHLKIAPSNISLADPVALKINGYQPELWADATPRKLAAQLSASWLHGCMVVGHNIKFDMMFLADLWDSYDISSAVDRRYIDTVVLAHEHLAPLGLRSLSMDNIRNFFGWSSASAHSALADAEDAKRLYYKLLRAPFWRRWFWWGCHKCFVWFGVKK